MQLNEDDRQELQAAKRLLENPGFAAKITNFLGYPIEKGLAALPDGFSKKVGKATHESLTLATDAALFTLRDNPNEAASNLFHKFSVATTGGLGGFFGIPGLLVELPISTTIMLRSIADIARSHGEAISDPNTKVACIEVFAMGGRSQSDDASESGYFFLRTSLARQVSAATETLVEKTIAEKGAPALARFIVVVAERFGIQVTEKAAIQFVPILGAAGGASINLLFIEHFQSIARGHFVVRKLERKYGRETIEEEYRSL